MWNGMRFYNKWKFIEFHFLDPVGWSLSAWSGIQCFKHFKGFCQFDGFEIAKLAMGQFRDFCPSWSKGQEGKAFWSKITKLVTFGHFKAPEPGDTTEPGPFNQKLTILKIANFWPSDSQMAAGPKIAAF